MSTFTACAELVERIMQINDRGQVAGLLLVDQRGAYDMISHQLLIKKMECYKFDSKTMSWFQTYLGDRMSQVKVQDKLSETLPVGDHGTTQGSVLGGTLFTIYSNDLPAEKEDQATDYVDDHADQVCGSSTEEL